MSQKNRAEEGVQEGETDPQEEGEQQGETTLEEAGGQDGITTLEDDEKQFDTNPPQLMVTSDEMTFMQELHVLLFTLCSVKRLVNLYGLFRISLSGKKDATSKQVEDRKTLQTFVGDRHYRHVQLLLAMLVGFPELSKVFFSALRNGKRDERDLYEMVKRVDLSEEQDEEIKQQSIERLLDALKPLRGMFDGGERKTATFAKWCDEVSRYSFGATQQVFNPKKETKTGKQVSLPGIPMGRSPERNSPPERCSPGASRPPVKMSDPCGIGERIVPILARTVGSTRVWIDKSANLPWRVAAGGFSATLFRGEREVKRWRGW